MVKVARKAYPNSLDCFPERKLLMPARNLTPAFAATDCEEEARKWRLTDLAHQCIFCGDGRVEVTLAAPEEGAPCHPQHRGVPRLFGRHDFDQVGHGQASADCPGRSGHGRCGE